jgi:putative two-component system response regulator
VADVFDALNTQRPYKEAYPFDQCLEMLEHGRGTHFDPAVLDAFLRRRDQALQVGIDLADVR